MPEDDFYQSGSKSSESESEDVGQETFLAPKSALGGKTLKVGNKCEFEIKSIMEDEVELEYVEHKKDDDKKESKDAPDDDAKASIDRGISQMRMV